MSELVDLRRELDRWKDKYFTQSELFEEEKGFAEDYAGLLQRLLIRVSLAAESVGEELDNELNALRSAIRKATPKDNDLEKRLKRIDKLILAVDEGKQDNAEKVVEAMEDLVDQLMSIKLPRKQKNGLKKLSKSLKGRASHFREYPGILSEYAILQAEALNQIVGDDQKDSGFFSRIFGNDSSKVEERLAEVEPFQELGGEITEEDAELSVIEDAKELVSGEEYVPGFSSIAGHVRATLSCLLDQLVFPVSSEREVEKLRVKLDTKMNWYELGPTLDDLASLVISVVGKGQRDFEKFLLLLDERLGQVQDYLVNSQASDKEWFSKNKELDTAVREQVTEMSKEIANLSDLEELKLSVTGHLDTISDVMQRFAQEEEEYEQAKEREIESLRERLTAMENESSLMKEQLKEERQRALKDALTELPNREAFDERFEMEVARFNRYGKPATLVVGDVDHFKSVNDTYGHLSGDKVLQIIAKELSNRTRKTDFVARYGGEEFVIILPETDIEVAMQVINKTREMISRLPFHFKDERLTITMSFGLVAFDKNIERAEMFELADQALYTAKQNGRNRIEIAKVSEAS